MSKYEMFQVPGKSYRTISRRAIAEDLKKSPYIPVNELWLESQRQRQLKEANKSPELLELKVNPLGEYVPVISKADRDADDEVPYRVPALVDKNGRVFHNLHILHLALRKSEKYFPIVQFMDDLRPEDKFKIAVRYASQSGGFTPMGTVEIVGRARDKYNIPFDVLGKVMVKRSRAPGAADLEKYYNTYRIFKKYAGRKSRFGNKAFDGDCYSNAFYAFNHGAVQEAIKADPRREEKIVDMVMAVSHDPREPRLQDILKPCLQYKDTKDLILEGRYAEAKALLHAKRPHENAHAHPHYDIVASNEKMIPQAMQKTIASNFQKNKEKDPTFSESIKLFGNLMKLASTFREAMLLLLFKEDPSLYVKVALDQNFAMVLSELSGRKAQMNGLNRSLRVLGSKR